MIPTEDFTDVTLVSEDTDDPDDSNEKAKEIRIGKEVKRRDDL